VEKLLSIEGVSAVTPVIEDNALAVFGDKQQPVVVRGVPDNYASVSGVNNAIIAGLVDFSDTIPQTAIGIGISNRLGVAPNFISPIFLPTTFFMVLLEV
jgi:ABC-type lipoprotein release transport system permease subunit